MDLEMTEINSLENAYNISIKLEEISEKSSNRNSEVESEIDSNSFFSDGKDSESDFDFDSSNEVSFVIESHSNIDIELDNITREESEERINILLISWNIFVSIIAISLLSLQPENPKVIILNPELKLETSGPKIPHILLIYFQGATIDYRVHPKVSKIMDFGNFPDSDVYLPFYDSENLFIAYGNGNLDTTKVKSLEDILIGQ